jgi:hypothetical protein
MERIDTRLAALEARLAVVESEREVLAVEVAALQRCRETAGRRLWLWRGAAALFLVVGLLIGPPQPGQAQGGTVEQRLAVLEGKLARVFVVNGGNDIVISGANLNIVNGTGSTQTANGRGNLILGYNEARGGALDQRTGSHNLVLGQQNNYTSFAGIIGGYQNTISGPFAHVLTGLQNGALGFYTCVASGRGNNATGNYAAILGGDFNVASGTRSTVSGGASNTASGSASSASGGAANIASGTFSSVSGGAQNKATSDNDSVSGGRMNTASGADSSVTGGTGNTASGPTSSVSGGLSHNATGDFDWRAGSLFQES